MSGEPFPQLDSGNTVEDPVYTPSLRFATPEGLAELSQHMDGVGSVLGEMAGKAAVAQGQDQAATDVQAGTVAPQNPVTEYGASYNQVAKQGLDAQRKAALIGGMTTAYAANPDNPGELDKALTAVKAGMQDTPFAEVNSSLDNEYALQRADLIGKAQLGLRKQMTETQGAAFQTDEVNAAGTLAQLAAGASLDSAGAAKVTAGITNYAATIAKYGPPTPFSIAGVNFPADPTRTGLLSPAEINARAIASVGEAKETWIGSGQIAQPDAAGQAKYADDLRARYEQGDPIFAGLSGAQAQHLFASMDAQASKAGTDEKVEQATHAKNAEDQIDALQWGGNVDTHQMVAEAQASGDPGLVAKAQFYAQAAPSLRGVLKTVVARQLGLIPTPGQGLAPVTLDANGNPISAPSAPVAAPIPGQDPVADQVRGYAGAAGATPAEANTLVKFGLIESNLNPNGPPNGQSQGLFQFRPGTWAQMGGGDISSVKDQTVNALKLLRADTAALTQALGRPPTEGELYLAHQQGAAGAAQLLANPNAPAASIVGADAVTRNGGQAGMTAAQFAAHWTGRFDGPTGAATAVAGAPANAWTPPPGTKPGSPAFVAWANTQEGFSSDPIKFAAAHSVATVPPLIPQAALAQDPNQVAGWTKAITARYAVGRTLQGSYGVPLRMLTDAEKDDYKSILQSNPAAVVTLAQRLTDAIGPAGATSFLREVGQDGDTATAIHLGQLTAWGSRNAAEAAAQGLALKQQGAKDPGDGPQLGSYRARMDAEQRVIAPAFASDPAALASARNVADLMRLRDSQTGVEHPPWYYLQSALGATDDGAGHSYGGVATVNGAQTILPHWLRQDQAEPALTAIARNMPVSHMPVYANGTPMSAQDFSRYQMVERPGGQYALVNPQTRQLARTAAGRPFLLDLEAGRPWLASQLPGAVRQGR